MINIERKCSCPHTKNIYCKHSHTCHTGRGECFMCDNTEDPLFCLEHCGKSGRIYSDFEETGEK